MSGAPRTPPRTRSPPPVALNAASGIPYGYVPAYLPGSASLVEELDKELMVVLRDGRHLIGRLRSFDQFSNMVMEDTCERRMCFKDQICYYADVPLGLFVVRGDSMVLLGQVGEFIPQQLREVELSDLVAMISESGTGALNWDVDADLQA